MTDKRRQPQRPPVAGRGGPMGFIGMPVEKPKNFKKTMKRFLLYLVPHKNKLIMVVIFAVLSTIFAIAAPKVMSNAVNALQRGYMAKNTIRAINTLQYSLDSQEGLPKELENILKLPKLDTVEDAKQKAEIVSLFFEVISKLPKEMLPDSQVQGTGYTQEQIKGVIAAIEETNGNIDHSYIGMILMILVGMHMLSSTFTLVVNVVMVSVSQMTVKVMRRDIDLKLSRLPLKYYDEHAHGDLLSRVTNDIDTISGTLQQSLVQVITSVITIIGFFIMMMTISPVLTLIIIGTLPLYILVTVIIAKKSQKYFKAQQKEIGKLSGHVEEMYTGHKIIKAFSKENEAVEKFSEINDELEETTRKAQFISGIIMPLIIFIGNLSYVLISIVGGIWITRQILGIGDILAFIQYSRSFAMPITQTANIANILQSTMACAERVFDVLDEEEEKEDPNDALEISAPGGRISFEKVSFRYVKDVPLIDDMNISVDKGHTIAIVGPTGAGKTTLVNLMMRFYELDSGMILFDGEDITKYKRTDLRKQFGMVLQDTWLFNGTIKENIAYGRRGATMDEIIEASQAAHADHFIRTLPDGYDTVINEEGSNISLGQKQLLTIARAILADPCVMILDEATSSVDTRTELLIQNAMMKLMNDKTSFVIAHRLSTIREAEIILVMDQGRIIETGNHKQLLEKKGFYYDLYMSQFRGEDTA